MFKGAYTFNSIQSSLRILGIQVSNSLAHNQTQFDFIMHGHAARPQHGSRTRKQYGARRLQEEEWLLWRLVVELFHMITMQYFVSNCVPCGE